VLDDAEETQRLMAALEAALPIEATLTPQIRRSLSADDPAIPSSGNCTTCALEFGGPKSDKAHLVSITQLIFRPNTPLYREIDAYQRHRTKKLRKQGNLNPTTETFTPTQLQ